MEQIKYEQVKKAFEKEFGISKDSPYYNVFSFNHFAKCTTTKELVEICTRVCNKILNDNLTKPKQP